MWVQAVDVHACETGHIAADVEQFDGIAYGGSIDGFQGLQLRFGQDIYFFSS
jgi:hypothetical protein